MLRWLKQEEILGLQVREQTLSVFLETLFQSIFNYQLGWVFHS